MEYLANNIFELQKHIGVVKIGSKFNHIYYHLVLDCYFILIMEIVPCLGRTLFTKKNTKPVVQTKSLTLTN